MSIVLYIILVVAAYLLGSFPTAYFVVKKTQGRDIRKIGSGNVGSTNAIRAMGKPLGFLVFAGDVAKGLIPSLLGYWAGGAIVGIVCGGAAMVGHVFPVWLDFKGGKGIATGLGVALALFPLLGLMGLALWAVVLVLTDCVAAASVAAGAALCAMVLVSGQPLAYMVGFTIIIVLVIWKHRGNFTPLKK